MAKRGRKILDLVGRRYGMLTVIKQVEYPSGIRQGKIYWLCQCDCGKKVVVLGKSLKSGYTTSCGCYRKRLFAERYWKKSSLN